MICCCTEMEVDELRLVDRRLYDIYMRESEYSGTELTIGDKTIDYMGSGRVRICRIVG